MHIPSLFLSGSALIDVRVLNEIPTFAFLFFFSFFFRPSRGERMEMVFLCDRFTADPNLQATAASALM